ncbi:MAG: hypothetical protein IT314_11390 [Anaerolineales bacterium]|nr:hypothetical protein [Anaerolineales bacterium]
MEFSNAEIINAIVTSGILELHLRKNFALGKLIDNPDDPNIHYGSKFLPTKYQKEIYERRFKMASINDADETSKTNPNAIKKVLEFMEKHSENEVFVVTFNGENDSYSVWCGLLSKQIEAICVLKGSHIPDSAFKSSTS